MPPPRTPKYPLDVTPRFTTAELQNFGKGLKPIGQAGSGVTHDGQGDLWNFITFNATQHVMQYAYTAAAYTDLIDVNVLAVQDKVDALGPAVASLEQKCEQLTSEVQQMRASLEQLISFLGVAIPAWVNKEEVERGDDMGVARQSAEELGLVVVFDFDRQEPGFAHEDVVSINPPAGTIVKRGSTVTVVLNLQG